MDRSLRIPQLGAAILLSWLIPVVLTSLSYGQGMLSDGGVITGRTRLPDGLLGQPAITINAAYASVSGSGMHSGDFQRYQALARIPVQSHTCLHFGWAARTLDSTRYEVTGGLRFYFANPLLGRVNPDGPIMRPVVTIDGGRRFYGGDARGGYWMADVSLIVPASGNFTVGGGYRYYQEEEPNELIDYYGRLNVFFAGYAQLDLYSNPDGPPGYLAFNFLGGGSSAGRVGEAKVLLPLNMTTTVAAIGRGEWLDNPSQKALMAGFELSYYP